MAKKHYLAIDLGAESGRGMLGEFDGEQVALREIRRFATGQGEQDIAADGTRRWDWGRILGEIVSALRQAQSEAGGVLDGVGVDSWGVDFGLLDSRGALLEAPLYYRNSANVPAQAGVLAQVSKEDLWAATGIQPLAFNTLFQLAAIQQRAPSILTQAERLLLIPDLIHHALTGGAAMGVERTNGSTTQMMRPGAKDWNHALLSKLGIPSQFLGPLIDAGARIGSTSSGVPVYSPATHDTASAVAAVPFTPGQRSLFLSSGTWSLLGAELTAPILSHDALHAGFSNEGGVGGTTRFLKNIMGLWMVQECRRSFISRQGHDYGYAELAALAAEAPSDGPLVDAAASRFLAPSDMPTEIQIACRETGQAVPDTVGSLIRCCLESLALAYRQGLQQIQRLTGATYDALHIVGGGAQNRLLNQWTADATGLPVIAGPSEVTALGNVLGQMIGSGTLSNWSEARAASCQSAQTMPYLPAPEAQTQWNERLTEASTS